MKQNMRIVLLTVIIGSLMYERATGQTGNVGIGTQTPLARLHVKDSSVIFTATGNIALPPGNPPVSGGGRRMMWYPGKAAFRVGFVEGFNWDKDNIGAYSFASGFDSKASGFASNALGSGATAGDSYSFASGYNTIAGGFGSIAMGYSTIASSSNSIAMGNSAVASGNAAISLGNFSVASGALSTAIGNFSVAGGANSTAMGTNTVARASTSFALGRFNDSIAASNPLLWIPTDPLLYVGNGSSDIARKNALVILKNGNTGIGTSFPSARLHVADSSVVFTAAGNISANANNPPVSGEGRRLMWFPQWAAFRVGYVSGVNWNRDSLGVYSFASGYNSTASGYASTALGSSFARGQNSTAVGNYSIAGGDNSTAMGESSVAAGFSSTAMGRSTAAGNYSSALGRAIASGLMATALGSSNATGDYSTASGYQTYAFGNHSIAMGNQAFANSDYSIAIGNSTANGNYSTSIGRSYVSGQYATALGNSTAMGDYSTALGVSFTKGLRSTAMGYFTFANGSYSTAMGNFSSARAYNSLALGRFNDSINSSNPEMWIATDPLLYVGNGSADNNRSNALLILKNGDVGIGTSNISARTHIKTTSNVNYPQLLLDQNDNGFARLNFRNTATTNAWTIAATPQPTNAASFMNFYFQGFGDVLSLRGDGDATLNGVLTHNSDSRLKKHIRRLSGSLKKINELSGYLYDWIDVNKDNRSQIGLLAQEVQKVLPELVKQDEKGILSVNYSGLIPVMINALKEQQAIIERLQDRVSALEKN